MVVVTVATDLWPSVFVFMEHGYFIFLHLICRQMDDMVWQGLFRCLLFPAQSTMECNYQECRAKPWGQRPFPVCLPGMEYNTLSVPNATCSLDRQTSDVCTFCVIGMWSDGWSEQSRGEETRGEERKGEELSGLGLRDCSSPQTPAPLHRSLIKDSLCPRAAPLSGREPSRLCSEYHPVLLQADSAQLSPRDGQNSGFQSAGPSAFPCLWEIKRGTSARFTPPLVLPLQKPPPKIQEMRRDEEQRRPEGLRGVVPGSQSD